MKEYKQFMYHFCYPKNSIDARNVSIKDWNWITEQQKRWSEQTKIQKRYSGSLGMNIKLSTIFDEKRNRPTPPEIQGWFVPSICAEKGTFSTENNIKTANILNMGAALRNSRPSIIRKISVGKKKMKQSSYHE